MCHPTPVTLSAEDAARRAYQRPYAAATPSQEWSGEDDGASREWLSPEEAGWDWSDVCVSGPADSAGNNEPAPAAQPSDSHISNGSRQQQRAVAPAKHLLRRPPPPIAVRPAGSMMSNGNGNEQYPPQLVKQQQYQGGMAGPGGYPAMMGMPNQGWHAPPAHLWAMQQQLAQLGAASGKKGGAPVVQRGGMTAAGAKGRQQQAQAQAQAQAAYAMQAQTQGSMPFMGQWAPNQQELYTGGMPGNVVAPNGVMKLPIAANGGKPKAAANPMQKMMAGLSGPAMMQAPPSMNMAAMNMQMGVGMMQGVGVPAIGTPVGMEEWGGGYDDDCLEDGDEDDEVLMEKKVKRMLSNRASAKRSRQRRQERLDELEIQAAKLRVENAQLVRKQNDHTEQLRRFGDENHRLRAEVEELRAALQSRKPSVSSSSVKDGASNPTSGSGGNASNGAETGGVGSHNNHPHPSDDEAHEAHSGDKRKAEAEADVTPLATDDTMTPLTLKVEQKPLTTACVEEGPVEISTPNTITNLNIHVAASEDPAMGTRVLSHLALLGGSNKLGYPRKRAAGKEEGITGAGSWGENEGSGGSTKSTTCISEISNPGLGSVPALRSPQSVVSGPRGGGPPPASRLGCAPQMGRPVFVADELENKPEPVCVEVEEEPPRDNVFDQALEQLGPVAQFQDGSMVDGGMVVDEWFESLCNVLDPEKAGLPVF